MVQFELKDPRLGFVTITGIDVTTDVQFARVYFTVVGDEDARRDSAAALERAVGFIRRQLGKRLHMRTVPELSFRYDHSLERGNRIEELLRSLREEGADGSEDS
ncbi:ribosome-binding factor A [Geothermobacter ehrlichii]|uniref:Ribosome-binding factor A n=2 Tax=Geothermobacter ehrlichii TaxID=213224 RepID=A0A5D3WL13_9BACT|nr:ribosome-binding factor A [Geothermobacter ehrlichii]